MKRSIYIFILLAMVSCTPKAVKSEAPNGSELGFSLNFFSHQLGQSSSDENVSVSPYSAAIALSMLAEGTAGETGVELDKALNGCKFAGSDPAVNDSITLISANSVWMDDDFSVRNSYVNRLSEEYDAMAVSLNFSDPATVRAINNWCSENTEGKINGIIDELSPETVMILANALYLDAEWEHPFKAASTRDMQFFGAKAESMIPFMTQKSVFNYAQYEGNQLIQLPYKGGDYSMYILLPSEKTDVKLVEEYLSEKVVRDVLALMKPQKVNLRLPKFRVEYETSLVKTLQSMGVHTAFTNAADLSGIAKGPLVVSDILQKTMVEVDEAGTEAAAVTAAMINLTSVRVDPTPVMTVNRPFYYMLADVSKGRVLFIGRIMNL